MRVIYESDDKIYRILESQEMDIEMDNLKGDCYNPKVNTDIDADELKRQELQFENLVMDVGVYGYVLEKWNAEPGYGYEHVDSCWGFVGQYDANNQDFNHYIVDELLSQIPKATGQDPTWMPKYVTGYS